MVSLSNHGRAPFDRLTLSGNTTHNFKQVEPPVQNSITGTVSPAYRPALSSGT